MTPRRRIGIERPRHRASLRRNVISGHPDQTGALGACQKVRTGEAAEWYGKAAAQGIANSQYNLGRYLLMVTVCRKDYTHALKWFRSIRRSEG